MRRDTMTKRERVTRTVAFGETDRVPLYDILQNDAVIEHYAGRVPDYENGVETTALAVGGMLDMTRMVTGPQEPREFTDADGFTHRVERWTDWITGRPFHDVDGLVEWVKGRIRAENAKKFGMEDAAQLHGHIERLWGLFAKADPTGRDDPAVVVIESGTGLDQMCHAAGMELFTELALLHPDVMEEWFEALLCAELRRVAAVADPWHIPVALTYTDIAHKTGTIFPPAWLRQYWKPRLKRLNDAWHGRDTVCIFHSDGNLWEVMDDLVETGVDGLNPIEVLAGMTVGEVRRRYPGLVLAGGIDVSQLLCAGTPEEVRAACHAAMAETGGLGYFMGSTTEIHWGARLENVTAMADSVAVHGEK